MVEGARSDRQSHRKFRARRVVTQPARLLLNRSWSAPRPRTPRSRQSVGRGVGQRRGRGLADRVGPRRPGILRLTLGVEGRRGDRGREGDGAEELVDHRLAVDRPAERLAHGDRRSSADCAARRSAPRCCSTTRSGSGAVGLGAERPSTSAALTTEGVVGVERRGPTSAESRRR